MPHPLGGKSTMNYAKIILITLLSMNSHSLLFAQTMPIKPLTIGNAYCVIDNGHSKFGPPGGTSWSTVETYTIVSDSIINGHRYCFFDGSYFLPEFADSCRLVRLNGTQEEVIFDIDWSIGDTTKLHNDFYFVISRGDITIFGENQKFAELGGISGGYDDFIVCSKFGIIQEVYYGAGVDYSINLIAAKIGGVIYGSFPTGVNKEEQSAQTTIANVFPNPARGSFYVQLRLARPSIVKIEICNILGQTIGSLFEGNAKQGDNIYSWRSSQYGLRPLATGIYFLRINCQNQIIIQKVLLLH
jgi:hypothetical protein